MRETKKEIKSIMKNEFLSIHQTILSDEFRIKVTYTPGDTEPVYSLEWKANEMSQWAVIKKLKCYQVVKMAKSMQKLVEFIENSVQK